MTPCLHFRKVLCTFIFLLILLSCEKIINSNNNVLAVYQITDVVESDFDNISELTPQIPYTVEAFPNPFKEFVTIYSGYIPDQITISDKDGGLKKFQPTTSNTSFDFSEARPGVYYCEVHTEERVVRLQLFKTKN